MAHVSEATNREPSRWKRVFLWLKEIDERLHIDPIEHELVNLHQKVSALEESVSRLKTQIVSGSEDGQ